MYHRQEIIDFPERKNPRLKNYDYSTPGYYFITICTNQKKCIFGQPEKWNRFGKIAMDGFAKMTDHMKSVIIDHYIVMPNHVHAIVILTKTDINLSTMIGLYKSYVSRKIHEIDPELHVWQSSFHDHVIRNQKQYEKIWKYIENNPLQWEMDCFYQEDEQSNGSAL